MNPGHSVSIVDVEDRIFVDEISTPSCAVIMPVAENDFLQVCGDGTLQLIQLDLSGFQQNRERSAVFQCDRRPGFRPRRKALTAGFCRPMAG